MASGAHQTTTFDDLENAKRYAKSRKQNPGRYCTIRRRGSKYIVTEYSSSSDVPQRYDHP